ncbi:MAG: amidohydrolase family protein [Opitutales bacterium]
MRPVDCHVHLYPPATGEGPASWAAARGEEHWAVLCTRRRADGSPVQLFPTVDALLREMDAAGIARSVLLGWYWEKHETCVEQNRFYSRCLHTHPDRLSAFATLHPAAGPRALDEVRWARQAGFLGLGELSPHSQHVAPDDPSWRAVLALAGELDLPVNLHVTDPQSRPFPGRVDTPRADFLAMAREYPQTEFIFAHWGGGLVFTPEGAALPNVWYDTAASPLLYAPEVWAKAVAAVPAERLLFGSDHPLRLYPRRLGGSGLAELVREAREALPESARTAVLAANAVRLLGL